jgi:predicted SAM-dependent methyltransferase
LPFKDKSYDLVTAMSIMEHLPQEEIKKYFLPEISRVLKDEGLLLIHIPVKTVVTRIKKILRTYIVKDLPKWAIDDDGDVTHTVWLNVDEYSKLIQDSGFKIDYIRFNYIRSNEKMVWIKLINSLGKTFDGRFFDWRQGFSIRYFLLSKIASSVAFVCHKVI